MKFDLSRQSHSKSIVDLSDNLTAKYQCRPRQPGDTSLVSQAIVSLHAKTANLAESGFQATASCLLLVLVVGHHSHPLRAVLVCIDPMMLSRSLSRLSRATTDSSFCVNPSEYDTLRGLSKVLSSPGVCSMPSVHVQLLDHASTRWRVSKEDLGVAPKAV